MTIGKANHSISHLASADRSLDSSIDPVATQLSPGEGPALGYNGRRNTPPHTHTHTHTPSCYLFDKSNIVELSRCSFALNRSCQTFPILTGGNFIYVKENLFFLSLSLALERRVLSPILYRPSTISTQLHHTRIRKKKSSIFVYVFV